MNLALALLVRLARALALIVFVTLGTIMLVRSAPGYLSDAREMDAKYADVIDIEDAVQWLSGTRRDETLR